MRPEAAAPVDERALPSDEVLAERLSTALRAHGVSEPVAVVARRRVGHASTFPNEVVTVSVGRQLRRVFCKYEDGRAHSVYGHRRGLRYEAAVYRAVLGRVQTQTVACLGAHVDAHSGHSSLFLDYVEGAVPYAWTPTTAAVDTALTWLGRFHAEGARLAPERDLSFLIRYDRAYYEGWAKRTLEFARPLRAARQWVARVCGRFGEIADVLVDAETVVLHGEYYAKNVLLAGGTAYPVDWESAALGAGEVDVAAALDGRWDAELVERAQRAYAAARWPEHAPADLPRRLAAARLYTQLRWLGDRSEWTLSPDLAWRFDAAERAARELALV